MGGTTAAVLLSLTRHNSQARSPKCTVRLNTLCCSRLPGTFFMGVKRSYILVLVVKPGKPPPPPFYVLSYLYDIHVCTHASPCLTELHVEVSCTTTDEHSAVPVRTDRSRARANDNRTSYFVQQWPSLLSKRSARQVLHHTQQSV